MRKWLTRIQMVAENGETVNIWKVVVTTPGGETGENVRWSVLYSRVRGRPMLRGGWKLCFELYKDWKEAMIRATAFHSRPLLKVKVPLGHKSNLWRQSRSNYCVYADVKEDGGNVIANVPSSELPKKSMQTDNWGNLSDSRWRNICSLPLTREENQM